MPGLKDFAANKKEAVRSFIDRIPEKDEVIEGYTNGVSLKQITQWLKAPPPEGCGYDGQDGRELATYDKVRKYFWEGRHER